MDQGGACVAPLLAEKLFSVGGCREERQPAFLQGYDPWEANPCSRWSNTHSHTGSTKWTQWVLNYEKNAWSWMGRGWRGRSLEGKRKVSALDQNIIHIYKIANGKHIKWHLLFLPARWHCLRVTSSNAIVMTPAVASCLHGATVSLFPHPLLCLIKISVLSALSSLSPQPSSTCLLLSSMFSLFTVYEVDRLILVCPDFFLHHSAAHFNEPYS